MGKPLKRRGLGPGALVRALEGGGTQAEVAARLGVDRSTLHRWRKAGHLPGPRGVVTAAPVVEPAAAPEADAGPVTFAEWARATYELGRHELELVDLAQQALGLARTSAVESVRLAAMREFRSALRQLSLPVADAQVLGRPAAGGGARWRA